MQINQLLLLVVVFVLSFELMLGSWMYGIGEFFSLLCYSPFAVVFVFASLRMRYSYVIKIHRIHYHFLNLIFIGLYHATTTTTTKSCGRKAETRQRYLCWERESKEQGQRKAIALYTKWETIRISSYY